MFHVTARITVLSDKVSADEYGDETSSYDAIASHVPAHIAEKSRRMVDPQSGRLLTARLYLALVPASVEIKRGYRVKDEDSGQIYLVEHVHRPKSYTGVVPTRVEMKTIE